MSFVNVALARAFFIPTAAQQRLVLAGFILVVSALVWWQYTGAGAPPAVQKISATPLPSAVRKIDFSGAEASWSELRIDPRGQVLIDATTHPALAEAAALLPEQDRALTLARMGLLLEKQFGGAASEQIVALVESLQRYQELEQRWLAEHGNEQPLPYDELFAIQDQVLGEELAAELFSDQRRLAKMMLASQRIQNDASLTPAEKQQAMRNLQQRFQEAAADE